MKRIGVGHFQATDHNRSLILVKPHAVNNSFTSLLSSMLHDSALFVAGRFFVRLDRRAVYNLYNGFMGAVRPDGHEQDVVNEFDKGSALVLLVVGQSALERTATIKSRIRVTMKVDSCTPNNYLHVCDTPADYWRESGLLERKRLR